jgi:hypothetical protein
MQRPDHDPSAPQHQERSTDIPATTRPGRRRPAPVTILAVIQLLSGVGYVLTLAVLLGVSGVSLDPMKLNSIALLEEDLAASAISISMVSVLGVVAFASSLLLFRMKRLGWTLTMLVTGLSLSSQIFIYYTEGTLVPMLMITSVVTVLYLNQREVRTAFGIGRPAELSAPELEERA